MCCNANGRMKISSSKTVDVAVYAALLLLANPAVALAYIDPGYGPLLWQAAVAAGLGLAYKLYRFFSRLRSRPPAERTDDSPASTTE